MTERPRSAVHRETDTFKVGPSQCSWDGKSLTIHIDEITVPLPKRLRGTVHIVPTVKTQRVFCLNQSGNHRWWPIAPSARVHVTLDQPDLRWQGDGYFDMNCGDAPLEQGFTEWQWSRGATRNGAVILYEAQHRSGGRTDLAIAFNSQGRMQTLPASPAVTLNRTGWRVARSVRSDGPANVIKTLEDAPFYARSVVSAKLLGEPLTLMHESLSLDRFQRPIVQAMLPFRMPRARK